MKKDGLILYTQQYESIRQLSLEDKGRLLDAIFHYHLNGDVLPDLPSMVSMAFSFIRTSMDIDMKKYEAKCQKNRNNVNKRWNQTDTTVYDRIGTNTNDTDTETETETETDLDKLTRKKNEFKKSIEPFVSKYGEDMCNDFYSYWTEPNKSQTKLKVDLEKTWDVSRRLARWFKNEKDFKKGQNEKSNVYEP